MSSARWLSSVGCFALVGVAAFFTSDVASAQVALSPNNSEVAAVSSSESSSSAAMPFKDSGDAAEPAAPTPANGAAGGQYDNRSGARGGYGLKSHLTFEAGGGFNAPTTDSSPYITWGGNFTVGAGYRFTPNVSMFVEYQFIDDKLPGAIIAEAGATGGNAHIWSFTLDPKVDLFPKRATNVYLVGGGGFYRKVTNFTDPQAFQYCTYFYCGIGYQNAVVGHFSSNQGGWNIGAGVSHRFGGMYGDGKTEVFAEARYLDVMTPAVSTQPNGLGTTTVGADTTLIPVTFGVRF